MMALVKIKRISRIESIQFRIRIKAVASPAKAYQPIIPGTQEQIPLIILNNGLDTIRAHSPGITLRRDEPAIPAVISIKLIGPGKKAGKSPIRSDPDGSILRAKQSVDNPLILPRQIKGTYFPRPLIHPDQPVFSADP